MSSSLNRFRGGIRQGEYPESARGLETHLFIHHSLHSGTIDIGIIMAALSADVAVSLDRGESIPRPPALQSARSHGADTVDGDGYALG